MDWKIKKTFFFLYFEPAFFFLKKKKINSMYKEIKVNILAYVYIMMTLND